MALSPRWLASGSDWWIEPWMDDAKPAVDYTPSAVGRDNEHFCLAAGKHLARVHRIPTSWWYNGWALFEGIIV